MLLFLGLAVLGVLPTDVGAPRPRPPVDRERGNVLVLVADDMGLDQLGLYGLGSDPAPTPNLDRMAAEGVLFLNAWSQPTCSPTRATIQTGRYGFRTGIGRVINAMGNLAALPLSEVTLPEMLDLGTSGAYAHAAIGKWHLGNGSTGGNFAPNLAGYGHFAGSIEGQLPSYTSWLRVVNGVGMNSTTYATTVCVDDALDWIQGQDRPWLCVVDFQAPHAPFHRPPANLHTQVLPPGDPATTCSAAGSDPLPFYKAMVEALDHEIGRLLDSLPAGERERTTVLFLGDNGTDACLSRPPFPPLAKGTLSEAGLRVPMIACGYRVQQAGRSRALVNTTDLFATVAELAGVDLAATLPGLQLDSKSLVPILANPHWRVRRWAFAEYFDPNGPGQPFLLPPCPPTPFCQVSAGFDGPGDAELSSCGPPLYGSSGANIVPWLLTGARPGANAWLLIGPDAPAYQPQVGAWLASQPPAYLEHFVVRPDGTITGSTWTGSTSREPFYQFVVQDDTQPAGFAVSNALRMTMLWTNSRAIRGPRYKLVRFDPCREELYDLRLDPFEQQDLLAQPLSAKALMAYERLTVALDAVN